jgi:hypothetical protein
MANVEARMTKEARTQNDEWTLATGGVDSCILGVPPDDDLHCSGFII